MKVLDREGHVQAFLTTFDEVAQVFKLSSVEAIVHTYVQPTDQKEVQAVYVSPAPTEILRANDQMQLVQLSDTTVSLFFANSV